MVTEKNVVYPNEPVALAGNRNVKILGRHTVVDGCLAFDWTASGFSFNFHGTGFILSLGAYHADVPAYVKIIIDAGVRRQRFAVVNGSERLIVEGLTDTRHRVEVLKVTEGASKLLFRDVTLLGLGAAFNLAPNNRPRRLEFIGDSITAGYGVLGTERDPGYETFQQDGTYSYAYLTSEALSAEGRYICLSGKGIVCNCNGDRTDIRAGEYFDRQSVSEKEKCRDGWTPDAVIINIGTNDAGGPAAFDEFGQAGEALIRGIRERYPEAYIIWLYGMMNDYYLPVIKDLVKRLGKTDKRVGFVHAAKIDPARGEIGANGHPNVRADLRVSKQLAQKLCSLLGWRRGGSEGENNNETSEEE